MRQRLTCQHALVTGGWWAREQDIQEVEDWSVLDTETVLVFLYGLEQTCGWGDDDDRRSAEVADKRKIG